MDRRTSPDQYYPSSSSNLEAKIDIYVIQNTDVSILNADILIWNNDDDNNNVFILRG